MLFKSSVISKIILITLAIVTILVMVKLGWWQLDRSAFKAEKQMMINSRISQSFRELPESIISAPKWRYYKIVVRGEYLPELGFLVDNIVNNSVAGVTVVTPFEIQGSDNLILVNRGWVSWEADRRTLPIVQTPQDEIELAGILIPPQQDHFYLKDPKDSKELEQLWSQLDFKRFEEKTVHPVQPLILVLDSNQPGSYEYIEQFREDSWVARHKAYAVQWFGLAITLMIITLVLIYKYWIRKETT